MNDRQKVFVEQYLECWNASEAARRAGYNGKSNVRGSQLLADVNIKAEIRRRLDEVCMSSDEVLKRLAEQARGSLVEFITLVPVDAMGMEVTDDQHPIAEYRSRIDLVKAAQAGKLHLIKSIHDSPKTGLKIELYDAQGALALIGKHHGLFEDNLNVRFGPGKLSEWLNSEDGNAIGESESGAN